MTVEGISFRYKKAVWGIEDLSCCFPAGTVTAILGRNGIGKTTFCKILCGLLKQKVGTIKRENQVLSCAERRASSYLVMQDADYQIYADSVGNELVLGKKVTEDLRNRAYDALDAFHLTALKGSASSVFVWWRKTESNNSCRILLGCRYNYLR